ncbi:protein mono-ADP-ribosyltransferase PARP14-like isoform X2 [Boleophthalmus pectinirostris]|uniref:protein mono-ADP-ribosyltransferase PARP14-like isoform X2 n=1 Tax=Boleophthalmus pectinirostris TaxID=150288 RepID=UPI00242BE9EC|nr:protein mono-ADP-ribosyltransferase PARP14-like isoform X2 [Boleophthalmus pectinirostris]
MAEVYQYALLVEFEQNQVPKLRNKLTKYFQSKKLSCGGDCTVEHESGSRTAVLRFRAEQDQRNVLEKQSHQLQLGQGELHLTVRLMSHGQESPADKKGNKTPPSTDVHTHRAPGGGDGEMPASVPSSSAPLVGSSPSDLLLPTSCLLGNVPIDMTQEFVEMLVENIMKRAESAAPEGVTVEMIPALKSTVVTFKTPQECSEFVARCPQNRTFKSKSLEVRALEQTRQVLLEDTVDEELLRLYFEKEGVELETAEVQEKQQRMVLTFPTPADVLRLLQKHHQLRKKQLKLYPFYQSLGRALYGADRPPLRLPAPLCESTDPALLRFFSSRTSLLQGLRSQLQTHWCQLELNRDSVSLSPEPQLLQQEEQVIGDWTETVRSVLSLFMSQFEVYKLNPPPDLWRESLDKISALLKNQNQVLMVPDETNGILKVVGLKSDISKLKEQLCDSINSLIKRARREKTQVMDQIDIPINIFKLLSQDGLLQKLQSVYPEIKFDMHGPFPKVTGLTEEIVVIKSEIYKERSELESQNLEVDSYVLEFLKSGEQEVLMNALLTQKHAVLDISGNRIKLLACTRKDVTDAEEYFKSVLVSKYVSAEDSNVLQTIEWQSLVDELEKHENEGNKKVQIREEKDQAVVSGFKENVMKVSLEIDYFLKQNAHIQDSVVINPIAKLEYLQLFSKPKIDAMKDKVQVSFTKDGVSLSGARASVEECSDLVKSLVASVAFESLNVAKHGARKIFEDKDDNYLSIIADKTGCLLKIVDVVDAKQNTPLGSLSPNSVYMIKMPNGVEIVVSKADMCSYPVHTVVNATVEDLQLTQGLSAALLNAAGRQLQVECDKIILTKGKLKPGECEITKAGGSLQCQNIIHTIGPQYDRQNVAESHKQLKTAVTRSLELAEQSQCSSIAIPAISRNRHFPLNECAQTIVKAVKEHCEKRHGCLKSVHFVNNDDVAVRAMEDAVKMEFGGGGISHKIAAVPASSKAASAPSASAPSASAPSASAPSASAPSVSTSAPVDQNSVGKELTKEGVEICILKGNLEKATTDVIVNTLAQDLVLSRGAVSSALLSAAGPSLQTMVQTVVQTQLNQTGQNQLAVGDLIVTEGGNLSCLKVFHAVAPHYNQGQGNEQKVFSDEFQKKFPKAGGSSTAAAAPSGGPFSKVVSSASMHEAKMGGVSVQVVTGDITKETTDVIINSSNENFSLKSGVSKAILEAAGPAVESECQSLGAQPNNGWILTQPGNLKCKKILHLVGQTNPTKIIATVRDALLTCIKHSFTSVAFPAIGTGQGNVAARNVADAMLDAVVEVLSKNPNTCLKTVRMVIFQPQMLRDFHDSLQQRSASNPTHTHTHTDKTKESGMLGNLASKIKSFFVSSSPEKTQKNSDFVMEALKPTLICFHICGESVAKINSAKQRIDSLLFKNLQSINFEDKTILSLSQKQLKRLEELQRSMEVGIRVEGKNGKGSVHIEGVAKDVTSATTLIHEMLKAARQEEELHQKAELLSSLVQWQYAMPGQDFQSFDATTNLELEEALGMKKSEVKVKLNGQDVTVKLPKGPATSKSGQSLKIQRVNMDRELPEYWEPMDTTSTKVFTVAPGSPEYSRVEQLFKASCNKNIIKIERIQNQVLWESLQLKRKAMDQKNGHQNNERQLFHGTSHDTIALINEHGFNRSYAGKNATAYGKGTYFAVNAQYSSSDTYSRPNTSGEKLMYLCSVLTGDFTTGTSTTIDAPLKKAGSPEKFDSVVDNIQNPSMFIIFHDSHAYPDYLITFK